MSPSRSTHTTTTRARTCFPALITLAGFLVAQAALAQDGTLVNTFTNPTPAVNDSFGVSVAAVGSDRVLIGAYRDNTGATDAGAAYLFNANGTLLTTFTNPTPAANDWFGFSVAAVGSEHLLIGAPTDDTGATDAGTAYLFGTNGTLMTTFTNPTPALSENFGWSLAVLGSDRVLIGASRDSTGAPATGAAYLYRTNGTLLTTFTNPTPATSDNFGVSVAAVGSDRVLIGARQDSTGAIEAGAAYLLSTNGALLTTFTNPNPEASDWFGNSVAGLGSDRVLIGAPRDSTGGSAAGAAYLFGTNGTLLTIFTNPTPADSDSFGGSLAALGTDRVLIGAYQDDTPALNAGAAYVFSTDGTLLTTLTNPTPAANDVFGYVVAALGSDRAIIGAYQDHTGATEAGAAYLFAFPTLVAPTLAILPASPGFATISWAPNTPGHVLQESWALSPSDWTNAPSGASNPIVVPATLPTRFYRLVKP